MKITSWRNCLRKHFGRYLRPARPRTLAKSACVALGLATAWGGEAKADITFQVSITPAHDLLDAFVYYGNNSTGATIRSLGSLSAGTTHRFEDSIDTSDHNWPSSFAEVVASWYQPGGLYPLGFAVGGIYQRDGGYGVTLSYPNDDPITDQVTWEEFSTYTQFQDIPYPYLSNPDEQTIVDAYFDSSQQAEHLREVNLIYWGYTQLYNTTDWLEGYRDEKYVTSYGRPATMISFGDTRFAGTAIVSIVPEPSSFIVAIVSAGLFILAPRRTTANS